MFSALISSFSFLFSARAKAACLLARLRAGWAILLCDAMRCTHSIAHTAQHGTAWHSMAWRGMGMGMGMDMAFFFLSAHRSLASEDGVFRGVLQARG